jgi:hypothetical protein
MKGILESIPEFMQVAVALVIGIVLILITYQFFNSMQQSSQLVISGSKFDMARIVAQQITNCWQNHRYGLDSESDICKIITINSQNNFTEEDVVKFLDCSVIPDNVCVPNDCSKCVSTKYEDQDKIKWDVNIFPTNISIAYSGDQRAVIVSSTE